MGLFEAAQTISEAAFWAVEPGRLVKANVLRDGDGLKILGERFELASFDHVWIIAFGKAAAGMAEALADVLDDRLTAGVVVIPRAGTQGDVTRDYRLQYFEAAHPLPDERSVEAARRVMDAAAKAGANDLVLACVSGGGSSLLCLPAEGVTLDEKRAVTGGCSGRGRASGNSTPSASTCPRSRADVWPWPRRRRASSTSSSPTSTATTRGRSPRDRLIGTARPTPTHATSSSATDSGAARRRPSGASSSGA